MAHPKSARRARRTRAGVASAASAHLTIPIAFVCALLSACAPAYPHLQVGDRQVDSQLIELAGMLYPAQGEPEDRFVVIQEISKILLRAGARRRQQLFLTSYVEANPTDPNNAYYLTQVAEGYREQGSAPLAAHYFERILRNYPDAHVRGSSLHLTALNQLIALETDPGRVVALYKELIGRFRDSIDLGRSHFFLARAYEALGEWEQAVQAYSQFLLHPDTDIPGFPNTYQQVMEKVDFYYSDKSWVVEDLDTLVSAIKRAIVRRDSRSLRRLKAKTNFFTMSWEQQVADENVARVFDLASFPLSRVKFDRQLDKDSNDQEAYLRTTGWSYRIETWYLYFREIDFKADPEIDDRWEWAGIFFGEKL